MKISPTCNAGSPGAAYLVSVVVASRKQSLNDVIRNAFVGYFSVTGSMYVIVACKYPCRFRKNIYFEFFAKSFFFLNFADFSSINYTFIIYKNFTNIII